MVLRARAQRNGVVDWRGRRDDFLTGWGRRTSLFFIWLGCCCEPPGLSRSRETITALRLPIRPRSHLHAFKGEPLALRGVGLLSTSTSSSPSKTAVYRPLTFDGVRRVAASPCQQTAKPPRWHSCPTSCSPQLWGSLSSSHPISPMGVELSRSSCTSALAGRKGTSRQFAFGLGQLCTRGVRVGDEGFLLVSLVLKMA